MWAWVLEAVVAGALGWFGPRVIRSLPESVDAVEDYPTYQEIAGVPRLNLWMALGAAALVTVVAFAVPAHLLRAWAVLCGVGVWLFYIDWRTTILPTRIIRPLLAVLGIIVGVEALMASDWSILVRAVIGGFGYFAVFWLFWWVAGLFRAGSFGYGDVRFAAPVGLVLGSVGPWETPVGLYAGIFLGGVAGVILRIRGHRGGSALGPWMLLGAVAAPWLTRLS